MIALYKDRLLQRAVRYSQANLQSTQGLHVIQQGEVIMRVLMKVQVSVFLMMSLLVQDIYKKKDMLERY